MSSTGEGDLGTLAKRLGLGKEKLLEQALTHPTNKRIAWLGEAVLYLAVTEHLYRNSNAPAREIDPERQNIIRNPTMKEAVMNQLHLKVRVPPSERDSKATGI